jgi:peptide/nickel transport system permease protein
VKLQTVRDRLGRAALDQSFIIGSFLVLLFFLVAVLGPEVAPHNPFLQDRVQTIDGELYRAPIPPCDPYPLGTDDRGRDLLSLLLHGARQTLVIAVVATTVRLLLGVLLGTVTGWWPGSLFDRTVTRLIEFLVSVPGLIPAILLVSAIGIRQGQISFVVALSLVGWGEVTQIVRRHVLTIRDKLYVLAARTMGFSSAQAVSRHVLSDLLARLLVLAALEMGGVLLLLSELSFVHIFVVGGTYGDDSVGLPRTFDVPDWGAMLGTSWRYLRSRPWLPVVPALAFFVTILGFNLLGHGLQRLVETGRFHPSGRSLFCFLAVVALIPLGTWALLATTGIEAQFTDLACRFDVQRACDDVTYLTQPGLESQPLDLAGHLDVQWVRNDIPRFTQPKLEERPIAPGGGSRAAGYIAYQFEQAGLAPPPREDYFQHYVATRGRVTASPKLEILGPDGQPRVRLDAGISFDPFQPFEAAENRGEGELVVLGNTHGSVLPRGILLLLDPTEKLPRSWNTRAPGDTVIFRLVPDDGVARNNLVPPFAPSDYVLPFPNLLIGESTARQLLVEAGLDLDELRAALEAGEKVDLQTGLRVRVEAGLAYAEVATANIIGYLPAADRTTQGERILVTTTYVGPASREERIGSRSDGDASGVAVMLEVARLWRDLGFEPRRTVVFAAFDAGGGEHFVHHPVLPISASDTWTAVALQGLGTGGPRLARREVGAGLARAFDRSARRFGVRTEELEEWRFFFTSGSERQGTVRSDISYSGLAVVRPEGDISGVPAPSYTLEIGSPRDTPDHPDPELLAEAGRTVAHYLMVLSSR